MKRIIIYVFLIILIIISIFYIKKLKEQERNVMFQYYSCISQLAPDYSKPFLKPLYYSEAMKCLQHI